MRLSLKAVTVALLAALIATGGATSASAVGAGEISGRVYLGTTAQAAGAGDVVVSLLEYVGATKVPYSYAGGTVVTDTNGDYLFTGLPSSRFDVVFSYVGTSDFLQDWRPYTSFFPHTAFNTTVPVAFSLAGHVDINTLGNPATAGQVRVSLRNYVGGVEVASAMTDASGNYEFPSVTVRPYAVQFTVPGDASYPVWYYRAGNAAGSRDYAQATTFTPSSDMTGLNVVVGAGPTISGAVHDSAGNPLAGFTVRALGLLVNPPEGGDPFGPSFYATTAPDGSYVFRSLPLTYKYLVEAGQGTAFGLGRWHGNSFTDWTYANIAGGTSVTGVDIDLYLDSVVTGTISGPSVAILGPEAGWTVLMSYYDAFAGAWSEPSGITGADSSGHYSFDRLQPGNYKFSLMLYLPCVLNPDGSCATSGRFEVVARTAAIEVVEDVDIVVNFSGISLGSLPTGTLVKSNAAGSTQLYLVNGVKSLVPVSSVATATDAGISGTVTAVAPSALATYTVQPAALSNAIRCEGLTYVASGGKLWRVAASLVTGVTNTELYTVTCSRVPKAAYQPINGGLFLQSSSGPATYFITAAGEKRPVSGRVAMTRFSAPFAPEVLRVSDSFLNSLPTGAPIGSYFGKQPAAGVTQPPALSSASDSEVIEPLLTVDERATCYSDYFQALGLSMFAPLKQTLVLDVDCRRELAVG